MNDERYSDRQRPAHHTPVERFNEPIMVQVNVCTKDRRPVLAREAVHRLCVEVWQAADFWRVGHYVIMPDHIHLFCVPGRLPMPSLKQWVEYWKGQIAVRCPLNMDDTEVVPPEGGNGSSFKLWQRDFWDTQMRSRQHYEEKLSYVRMNPVRKELVKHMAEWPYQGEVYPIGWV